MNAVLPKGGVTESKTIIIYVMIAHTNLFKEDLQSGYVRPIYQVSFVWLICSADFIMMLHVPKSRFPVTVL
jgi:hypothetical protein